jgi:cell shape-determining protein MreD
MDYPSTYRARKLYLFLLFLFFLLLQQAPSLRLFYGYLDLSIPMVLVIGLWLGPTGGLAYGFIAGLIEGSYSGYLLGTYLITRTLIGWGSGMLRGFIVKENPWALFVSAFFASILNDFLFLLSFPHPLTHLWWRSLFIKSLSSALFAPIFATLMKWIYGE